MDIPLTMYRVTGNYIFARLDQARREEEAVVNNFFSRYGRPSPLLKARALANMHLRFAQSYYLKKDSRFKTELIQAFVKNPFQFKAAVMLILLLFPGFLRGVLSAKILRLPQTTGTGC